MAKKKNTAPAEAESPEDATPIPSAVDVGMTLTESAVPPANTSPALLIWSGFQYGAAIEDDTATLTVAALTNGLPQAGDACSVKPAGEEYFQPLKIKEATESDGKLILTLRAAD